MKRSGLLCLFTIFCLYFDDASGHKNHDLDSWRRFYPYGNSGFRIDEYGATHDENFIESRTKSWAYEKLGISRAKIIYSYHEGEFSYKQILAFQQIGTSKCYIISIPVSFEELQNYITQLNGNQNVTELLLDDMWVDGRVEKMDKGTKKLFLRSHEAIVKEKICKKHADWYFLEVITVTEEMNMPKSLDSGHCHCYRHCHFRNPSGNPGVSDHHHCHWHYRCSHQRGSYLERVNGIEEEVGNINTNNEGETVEEDEFYLKTFKVLGGFVKMKCVPRAEAE